MSPAVSPTIGGRCDPRFSAVRDAFACNFTDHSEVGAAVCIVVDDRVVTDLWAGSADQAGTRPWGPDTLVNVFSVGKAMIATCVARLIGQGRLDAEAPVISYWPEFGAAGKDNVTVAQVLCHQAGLPAVRAPLPDGAMLDWVAMTTALEQQEPWWTPGAELGYHVNTFGFLAGELVRRVSGETPGAFLRNHVTGPINADVHIGLAEREDGRVAELSWDLGPQWSGDRSTLSEAQLMEYCAYFNPSGISGIGVVNTRAWRAAEIPSTNAHATARGVARVYHALVCGGALDGTRLVDEGALRDSVAERARGEDLILHKPARFGLGFQLTQPERPLGPNQSAFGHFGAGGSLGFADPDAGVAFGYVMNHMGPRWQNPRNRGLIDALYASL